MAEKRNIDENIEKENIPPKKKRLSLSLKNRKDSGRFGNTSKDRKDTGRFGNTQFFSSCQVLHKLLTTMISNIKGIYPSLAMYSTFIIPPVSLMFGSNMI